MIFTWVIVALLWSSLVSAFDLGGLIMPDIAVVISVWAGLRVWHRHEDIILALAVGLTTGLFTIDPWFLSPLLCLIAVIVAGSLRARLAPQSLIGRALTIAAVLLVAAAVECTLRVSVPSLILDGNTVFGIVTRTLISVPLAVLLDQVTPQRR